MDKTVDSSSDNRAQRLYDKNIELENRRRKAAQAKVPSDPNAWQQMRENFETIILEDHSFSEKHSIEFALWQLHYRKIEEFRAHYNAASAASDSKTSRGGGGGPARALKIRAQFKNFLSEATGFYHHLILKIRAKYGLPMGQFYPEPENHKEKDGKIKKGLVSCHRCFIYLGDLARYKGLYGEGESKSRDYAAASSYYLQSASLWPSSGNPHHQLAILATYSGDELMAVYRYFRSLAAENPFSTARDNLIVAFEKNRQTYSQLHLDSKASSVKELPARTRVRPRGKVDPVVRSKESVTDASSDVGKATDIRPIFKAFRVRFVRLNGILFTRTSLETFEEILSLVTSALHELLSSGPEEEMNFGTDAVENGLFIVILVSILIYTVNNVNGGTEGRSYADIVQNTLLLKNSLVTFYEIMGILLKRCLQVTDLSSSFLLPGILICMEWIACHPDVVRNEIDEKRSTAQIEFWRSCISLFNKLLSAGLVTYDDDDDDTSCFTDMTRYEEGENDHQPSALWEDFELRGFLPLQPAQTFLDFSRLHSDNKKDKVARVKRILTAGKIVADMITIDHKKVRFDSKLKKFVIGVEPKNDKGSPKSNGGIKELSSDTSATVMVKLSKAEDVEGEEEDEVILFRPNLTDNRTEVLVSKGNHQEGSEQIQNIDVGTSRFSAPISVPDLNAVHTSSQSAFPVNSSCQSIRLPVNSYPQSIGQPVNSYPQSTGQPVNSYPQSTGQSVNRYPQSTEHPVNSYPQSSGQPVNSYPQSTVQPVNSYPQSTGQPINSYTQSTGPPVNSYPQNTGQPVNSYPQSSGQPVNSYPQSIGQPLNNYPQSIDQSVNGYIQSRGQQHGNDFNQSSIGQSYQFQSPMWPSNQQVPVSVGVGLQGLSLQENGQLGQTAVHRDFQSMMGPTVIDREATTKINMVPPSGPDPYLVGRTIHSSMPTGSLKGPINRPVRHLGPPPGFGSVRSKQVNDHFSASSQNPLNDDYSWLDGYQLQSSLKTGLPINLPPNMSSQYANDFAATPNFPFPGKQGPVGQFEGERPSNMDNLNFQSLQQRHLSQVDQQGQPMWKGN
ncbi:nonsense-mediated mRNA decay factor SMG7-like [Rutidosis leptorrhynchoides]|uniref:nonsense-mediated mRNA decay factor SMG7-like n=1 Tax=Rutidosis leptorrhynchoides TaxID=125765 RepID=UPI003A99518E